MSANNYGTNNNRNQYESEKDALLNCQLLPPGGITPLGKGMRGGGPFVDGVGEMGDIAE